MSLSMYKKIRCYFFLTRFLSQQIEINVDSLVVQTKGKGIRLSVGELFKNSDIHLYIQNLIYTRKVEVEKQDEADEEIYLMFELLDQTNRDHLVDLALDNRDKALFYMLTNEGVK